MKLLQKILKKQLTNVEPYSYLRNNDPQRINLDLNEAPYKPYGCTQAYNFYPETQPRSLLKRFSEIFQVNQDEILITRGGDESIQLIVDTFATPYKSAITITSPTFDSYQCSSIIDGVKVVDIPLKKTNWQPDWVKLAKVKTNVFFLCSPGNPIGNIIPLKDIMKFAKKKLDEAIIVVDEAYLEFSSSVSATTLIKDYPNIVVLKTLSKAYALAGVRVGITIGNREIIKCLLKSLAPYPLPAPCIDIVDKALSPLGICYYQLKIKELIEQREMLTKELAKLPFVKKVFSSSTNFILLEVDNPDEIVQKLSVYNIAIKNKSKSVKNCIRISVGNQEQNSILLSALKDKNMVSNIRKVECSRITKETQIFVETILDNKSKGQINTGVGFFDHMLDQIKKHSGISLNILAKGDIEVDEHHLIEDTGILFGQCLKKALGNKVGIERYASNTLVMDEAKAAVSIDICDRAFFTFNGKIPQAKVGAFPSDMVFHFFDSIAKNLNATLNISVEGENSHHIIEVIFKCFAKTLKDAIKITSDQLMSTKGVM